MIIRGTDRQGSGAYRAKRGHRLHNGIDVCCERNEAILAVSAGIVTKIGFPYSQGRDQLNSKRALRYVQITDENGLDARYFYVAPAVRRGDKINRGDMLGVAQGVAHIYAGITEHYHFEVLMMVNRKKVFCDPEQYVNAQI